ncbi:hypothetical protein J4G37_24510 [Microvirga sp. 3-52]|nr:hypothetical protein [Microvirga sp. 3-52]
MTARVLPERLVEDARVWVLGASRGWEWKVLAERQRRWAFNDVDLRLRMSQ